MTFKCRKIATVDVGTNCVLLLVAKRDESGTLTILRDESRVPKLGEGLRETHRISPEALARTVAALSEFSAIARESGAGEIFVTATSAAREAENRDEFLREASAAAGVPVEVIPANEEARLSYVSVTGDLPGDAAPCMVVDIGGGSTEVTWGLGNRFDGGRSLNLGTVKLTEAFLGQQPPSPERIEAARREIDERLNRMTPLGKLARRFGTAGSFTHLASIDLALPAYRPDRVYLHRLSRERIAHWTERFSRMTREELVALPGLDPRRADVVLSGTLIIERLCHRFETDGFEVADRGVRFGSLLDRLKGFVPPIRYAL